MKLEDLITGQQAADILGFTRQALANHVADGNVKPVMRLDNGHLLYDRQAIQKYADQRAEKASA